MTLVDTSVWIDFLEGGEHWTKERFKEILSDRKLIVYIDMILLEIIQGLREQKDREKIEKKFRSFRHLPLKRSAIMLAAEIYQELQRKGIRIRSIVDCLISAVAIETGARILHKNRDFDRIAEHYPVMVERKFSLFSSSIILPYPCWPPESTHPFSFTAAFEYGENKLK